MNGSIPSTSANIYTLFGAGNTSGKILKPVIFVEGIDFGDDHYPDRNGEYGWCQFWGLDNTNYPEMANMPSLLNQLRNNGYDITLIDFYDGATDIPSNALVVVSLLDYIKNQTLPPNVSIAPATVIGGSMGGVVARYALSYMEKKELNHCTNLYTYWHWKI